MPTEKSLLGKRAEELGAADLVRLGYKIIERNYRCRWGEIDVIARDGPTTVFVEVRSRRSNRPTSPAESVTERKQEKLVLAAQHYLTSREMPSGTDCRFDVIEVRFERGKPVAVEVIVDAFGER